MFCTYCNTTRIANEAPCPNCGAPSPLLGRPANNTWNQNPPPTNWGNTNSGAYTQEENQVSQLSFENPANVWQNTANQQNPFPVWQQNGNEQIPMTNNWQQGANTHEQLPTQEQFPEKQSFLPVPYQNNLPAPAEERQSTMALQLIPDHAMQHLLPTMTQAPATLYVAPMYTKPRPLIPKYRAISGLISVIIVVLLACGGATYYAKASGKLHGLSVLLGRSAPPNLQLTAGTNLPDPPQQTAKDFGPSANILNNTATTTSGVDANYLARDGRNVFQPGQTFYVTFHINATTDGNVYARWYTNGTFYRQTDGAGKINGAKNASIPMVYPLAANGSVEIYWNGQLAERLYFVVRN